MSSAALALVEFDEERWSGFSASGTKLLSKCALPFAGNVRRREARRVGGREWGNAAHAVFSLLRDGKPIDLPAIADAHGLGVAPDTLERLGRAPDALAALKDIPALALSEAAFAYNPETREARMIGQNIGRRYLEHGARRGDWVGTADLVWMATDGSDRVMVLDLKTGWRWWDATETHIEQLLTLALFAARAFNTFDRGARVAALPMRREETAEIKWHPVEDYELEAHETWLHERLRDADLFAEPSPGPHCTELFCDAIDDCPAAGRVTALIPADRLTARLTGPIRTAEEAGARALLLHAIKAAVKAYEADLEAWSDAHDGIATPQGRWVKKITPRLDHIEWTPEAATVIANELGEESIPNVAKIVVTKSAIYDELRRLGRSKLADTADEIVATLAKVGAVKWAATEKYDFEKGKP